MRHRGARRATHHGVPIYSEEILMFEAANEQLNKRFEALATRITELTRRIAALEDRTIKEDRGDFLPVPSVGHNQSDLDEIKRLEHELKEATHENVNLSDELRHVSRRVLDYGVKD
jgi:predicted  nucleic acid-binding Zn-ribbon protein